MKLALLLLVLLVPSSWRMLKQGIFSMHDLHIFRLFEFEKCLRDLQIPCRWSPDVTFEYGQPLFNFYGQLPYLFGEVFRLINFSLLDSLKLVFISSLVLSAISMFILSKSLWKNNLAALVSALIYTYAPYRAVDIYVRGALPESMAFIFFPLIIYFFNKFLEKRKILDLLFFSLSFSLLVLTHNLSALMFIFFLIPWGIYYLHKQKAWKLTLKFIPAAIIIFGLTSFYLLPVIFENKFVSLESTNQGYFDFHNHFTTLNQLLISRYWDYGGSSWGNDDRVSLSIGHVQWIIPLAIFLFLGFKKQIRKYSNFFALFIISWFLLWLTHNKSTPLWEIFLPLKFIQFPWRFLGLAVFSFALSTGIIIGLLKGWWSKFLVSSAIIASLLALNIPFFFEDLWFYINDKEQFSGARYEQLISSSAYDYYPKYGSQRPVAKAPEDPIFIGGEGEGKLIEKRSNLSVYKLQIASASSEISFPIVYFPGWRGYIDDYELDIYPQGDFGLITTKLPMGENTVKLKFTNTQIRSIGNGITIISVLVLSLLLILNRRNYEKS